MDATRWFFDFTWPQVEKLAEFMEKHVLPSGCVLFDEGDRESYLGLMGGQERRTGRRKGISL